MAILNQTFLRQTQFDSASPAGTAVVVHRFDRVGEFQLAVSRGDEVVQRVAVNVGRGPEPAAPPRRDQPDAPPLAAVAIDVTRLLRPGARPPELDALPSEGYLSITSSQPQPEHHLVVRAGEGDHVVLDTRRLDSRSLFALTLVRPGRYRLRNGITDAEAAVVVNYPKVGKTPYRPPAPLEIRCTPKGFGASTFTIDPAQGIVFRFETESRIQIELVEPDDGPQRDRPSPKASFRRPPEPRGKGR